ncbi:CARDB domain-containing protein [Terrimicrobium sacchariphilum]|uniref:CARDB domain-containing protein n=1 Tax=Terrimicrobium sacchariphilum TaxID=690879 RepID=UPI001471A81A|nr:CARDB domain-containing protein [Terrimicrobium sacchariphilum]
MATVLLAQVVRAGEELPVPEPARPADSFVQMIGVATHFNYRDTMYDGRWEAVRDLLGGLGVRTIRDDLSPRHDELWEKYGIRVIAIDDDPATPWEQKLRQWREKRHLLAAIEGPNEVNGGWKKLGKTYHGRGWPEGPREFQDDLYSAIKADAALKDIPVIAASTAYKGDGSRLAPLRSFDIANTHSYPAGAMPSESLDFRDPYLLLGRGAILPPLAATETGYHTCLASSQVIAGTQAGVSHEAQRKYLPRLLAEYFDAGFRWTVLYELGAGRPRKAEQEDPEAAFGLLMPDASPKPAYFALRDLIASVAESRWDASARQWVRPAPYRTGALAFTLRGAPPSVHHTLLQRSDGSFLLLLWNEVPGFDRKARKDIANAPVPVRLVLAQKAAEVTVVTPGGQAAPCARFTDVSTIDLQVPDEVLVVTIKPAAPIPSGGLPLAGDVASQASPTSITLDWPAYPGPDAWWVYLHGRKLGQAAPGTDGRLHFTLRDLLPATTYPLEIIAASRDGRVSDPARIAVATIDAFPDLVIRDVKTAPANPRPGEEVRFLATVENTGSAPTGEGVTIGVKFSIDGKTVCWNDALRGPLAPGRKVEVSANNGPQGRSTWKAVPGSHTLTAQVDDVNRLIESDELNNTASATLDVAAPPPSQP